MSLFYLGVTAELSWFYVFIKSQVYRGSLLLKMAEISSYFYTKDSLEEYYIETS